LWLSLLERCYKTKAAAKGVADFLKKEDLPCPMPHDKKIKEEDMGFLFWIFAGLIAGWLTGKIMKGSGYGFFGDILLGIAGGILGGFIARHLGFDPAGKFIYSTLVAVVGAVILVAIVRLIKR
jgi:uncharacterized membrane protein YeaQ/YmgE (transglycosylase-associated protein family)